MNETGPSLVISMRVDQFYVLRFLFCQVYFLQKIYLFGDVQSEDIPVAHAATHVSSWGGLFAP